MFSPIRDHIDSQFSQFPEPNFIPSAEQLNQSFHGLNENNQKLCFAPQDETLPYPDLGYEQRIFEHGLIATREKNWHDYFNALVWKTFPQLKSCLNAVHYREQQKQDSSLRSRRRDWLTLFDENGVIVLASEEIKNLIKTHQWQELFINHADQWRRGEIQIQTFGHALYEKYLNPYIGMTAHAIVLDQGTKDPQQFIREKIIRDELLVEKTDLMPLPLLGIPDWHPQQSKEFYSNKNYFR